MSSPSVAIVIVNWDGKDILRRCVESFLDKTEYKHTEIIVFDNDSDDGSQEMIEEEFPDVTLMACDTNLGYVGGENEAFLRTDHDMYFFLNNDTAAVNEGWLRPLVKIAQKDGVGIVGPKVIMGSENAVHGGAYFHPLRGERRVSADMDAYEEREEVDWVSGAQILVTREVMEDIGLFDETFWPAFMEEVDLCWRAKQAGYRVMYEPGGRVKHYQNESVNMDLDKFYTIRKYGMRFRLLNYPLSWIVLQPLREIKETAGCVLRRDDGIGLQEQAFGRLKMQAKAYWWNIKTAPEILRGRKKRRESYKGETDLNFWRTNAPVDGRMNCSCS